MRTRLLGTVLVLSSAISLNAQQPPMPGGGTSVSQSTMLYYTLVKDWIMKSAAAMPDADYSFRPQALPAPDKAQPRTFAQLIGHVADANYMFCGAAGAMTGGTGDVEKSKTAKADLQKALADSFAFCDKVWAATTDQNALTAVKFPAGVPLPPMNRIGALAFNTAHEAEHYGNVVTYLRLRGHVPPSSQAMPAR